jgi:hypothetical protein
MVAGALVVGAAIEQDVAVAQAALTVLQPSSP